MYKDGVPSPALQKAGKGTIINKDYAKMLFLDIKSLFKAPVLVANVLPVLTGFWLALYYTNTTFGEHWQTFLLMLIGSTLVMAGALVINNWYDVDIDTVMKRTEKRPTVTGHFPLKVVLFTGIICTLLGFFLLLFTTITATVYAFIGWFTYVILYTMWSKRRYTLNTVIGAVSGAVTPLIGWTVLDTNFHIVPLVLAIIIFIWQMPHTFSIAMKKYDEYKAANVAMLPVVHGFKVTKRQMAVYVICLLPFPFYLTELGTTFIVVTTLLTLGWIVVTFLALFSKNDYKWAQVNFLYSVNYLTIVFLLMIIVTLPIFH